MECEGAKLYPAMDRIKTLTDSWRFEQELESLSESWSSCLILSVAINKLRKRLGRSPKSADRNPISTGATIVGIDDTVIHNTFSNMKVLDASGQAPLHAGSDKTSEPSLVGAISTETQGSELDMSEPPNLGMVELSAGSKSLLHDKENTALKSVGITHQADAGRKETFEEIYFFFNTWSMKVPIFILQWTG